MNILFVDQFNQPGGAQQCLLDLLPAVAARGWNAIVMLPGEGPLGESIRASGVMVLPVRSGPYAHGEKSVADLARFVLDAPRAAVQIAAACHTHKIDVVYVNGPRMVPAAVLAVRRRIPIVFHCHSYLSPGYAERLTGMPLRWANARVVASSTFVGCPLRRWIKPERMETVYNGVAEPRICCKPARITRIGTIGRIAPEKGQDLFLRAARILRHDLPSCEFVVCGSPLFSDSEYERKVRLLARGMPVEFTGWLDDVEPVLATLHLLVVPSTAVDATPRIVLQAFASGVPVIAFASGGFPELIDDGRTGFLVPKRSAEALAEKMRELLLDPARLQEAAERGRESWRKRFRLSNYRERILRILEESAKT